MARLPLITAMIVLSAITNAAAEDCGAKAGLYETTDPVKRELKKVWVIRQGIIQNDYSRFVAGYPSGSASGTVRELIATDGSTSVVHGPMNSYNFLAASIERLEEVSGQKVSMFDAPNDVPGGFFRIVLRYDKGTPVGPVYRFKRCEAPPKNR